MKTWQFCSLQSSIFIVASLASNTVIGKILFLILAVAYMIGTFVAQKKDV